MKILNKTSTVNFILISTVLVFSFFILFYDLNDFENHVILLNIRLPRLISAISVATILSLSGLVLQALFKNDLAEPSVLGISSGGTLGAVIGIFLLSVSHFNVPYLAIPLFSVLFSFLSIYLIIKIAGKNPYSAIIILLGVAINSFNGALITLISYLSDNSNLRNVIFWGMGSFTNTNIYTSTFLGMVAASFWILFVGKYKLLNALRLNDENLFYAGFSLKKIQTLIIITATIAVGISVAFCGLVSFVGLIAPHIARLLVGHNHKDSIITTPLVAIALILFTDILCKNLLYPIELPTSVITSFIGAPYFIHLIFNSRKHKIDY